MSGIRQFLEMRGFDPDENNHRVYTLALSESVYLRLTWGLNNRFDLERCYAGVDTDDTEMLAEADRAFGWLEKKLLRDLTRVTLDEIGLQIRTASCLNWLCCSLNEFRDRLDNPDHFVLLEELEERGAYANDLPVFSKNPPSDMTGIFSYDDTHKVVLGPDGSFMLVRRNDL